MGWGFLDPTRLFRKTWKDAGELAMELYAMATEQTPAKMHRPVELVKQPNQPALLIGYPPSTPEQRPGTVPRKPQDAPGQAVSQGARSAQLTTGVPSVKEPETLSMGPGHAALQAANQEVGTAAEKTFFSGVVQPAITNLVHKAVDNFVSPPPSYPPLDTFPATKLQSAQLRKPATQSISTAPPPPAIPQPQKGTVRPDVI